MRCRIGTFTNSVSRKVPDQRCTAPQRAQAFADCLRLTCAAARCTASGTRRSAMPATNVEGNMKASWRCHLLAGLLAVATVDAAAGQTAPYPNKPVQIIADSSAGSTPDVALRFVADRLTQ